MVFVAQRLRVEPDYPTPIRRSMPGHRRTAPRQWHNRYMPAVHDRPLAFLGGLSAARFMRDYWQKKPLLIRAAVRPGWITPEEVFAIGARDDIEARLVSRKQGRWHVSFGPQQALPRLKRDWTLLVQGANLYHRAAAELLQSIDFLPAWRLDDVMLSYAVPGGGVGPHVDSYDVFLLQVQGRRRWRISAQRDQALQPNLPLKILADFRTEQEWLLDPGDMLYLPPNFAHDGVAETETITASIGFRAPSYHELAREFLHHMADTGEVGGRYRDRGRKASKHPGELDRDLIEKSVKHLLAIRFSTAQVVGFLGTYLSEPKATVFFEAGTTERPAHGSFGLSLDARTIMLYRGRQFFINGETLGATAMERRLLKRLADERCLSSADLQHASPALLDQFDQWLASGWLNLEKV